jgi:branched-chain amino acid transport system ATP-binding protein
VTDLLRVREMRAGYGDATVLDGVSAALGEGQTLALLGRNGTGKTTLINALVGAATVHAGSITLDGQELCKLPSHVRASAGLGWVPQERNIFKSLTVHENLTAVARPPRPGRSTAAWTTQRVYALFPRLAERRGNLGSQLSGGEQQMLAVGRALVLNPRVLLLDEPLEGLAPILVEELLRAIRQVTREEAMSAIIVEQHPQAVLAISDRAVVLDHGTVVHEGDAQALLADTPRLERLLGAVGGPGS